MNTNSLGWAPRAGALIAALALGVLAAAGPAGGALLSDLLAGASLDAGSARFSAWELVSLDASSGPNPNLALITVLPLVNDPAQPGVQLSGNGQLTATGVNSLDLVLRFRVQPLPGGNTFTGYSVAMTGVTFGGDGGVAYASQEAVALDGTALGAAVAFADNQEDVFHLNGGGLFSPRATVQVTTNVFLNGLDVGDSINLGTVNLRLLQTGPNLLPGDFDHDFDVDGADFLKWQRGESPAPGSETDFGAWAENFGWSIASGSAATSVPEPSAAFVAWGAVLCLGAARRRLRA